MLGGLGGERSAERAVGGDTARENDALDTEVERRPPYELENAFREALEAGETVIAVEIGKTRDLTYPLDLVKENFPYLRAT